MKKEYPVCTWIPLTFLWLYLLVPAVALLIREEKLAELVVSLLVTTVGVFLALWLQRSGERRKDRQAQLARTRQWIRLIRRGAEANAGLVKQMLDDDLPKGCIPTYPNDSLLERALQGATWDLPDAPDLVEAHRAAVFELGHLSNKIKILIALRGSQGINVEFLKTIKIAENAKSYLAALRSECDKAEQALPRVLHSS